MKGQPNNPGAFVLDVSDIAVTETGLDPKYIIPESSNFYVALEFSGAGVTWDVMETALTEFKIQYFAEGMGVNAADADLGEKKGNLVLAQGKYGSPDTRLTIPANTLKKGIYQLSALVTFTGWPGHLGFVEGSQLIQIY